MMKTRSEVWLQDYSQSRYLRPLSREALAERLRWLIENIATLDEQGQIGAVQPNADHEKERIWIAFTHTMQEFWLRGQNPPDQFLAGAKMPTPSYPSPPRELSAYQDRKRSEPGQVFKYGKKAHLSKLLTTGEVKVRPASSYKDPSLNYAVSDDELQFTLQPKVSDLRLVTAHGSVTTATINYATFVLAHPSDFYVYCMASQFALRLFKDFEADSCLIVYDTTEFIRRFREALESKLPDWKLFESYVSYVDPSNPGPHAPIIPISKHLRFVYQREFRLIFHPRLPMPPPLEDLDIEMTPCGDIAELIDLN